MRRAALFSLSVLVLVTACGGRAASPQVGESSASHSTPTSVSAKPSAGKGRIAFLADYRTSDHEGERYDVYTVKPDGAAQRRLTRSGDVTAVSWAPDGEQLAYIRQFDLHTQVWGMNADGSGQRPLSERATFHGLDWSPDGVHIMLSGFEGVLLLDVRTRKTSRVVAHLPGGWRLDQGSSWSADGRQVVVVAGRRGPDRDEFGDPAFHFAWFVADVDTGRAQKIARSGHRSALDWSWANGKMIFHATPSSDNHDARAGVVCTGNVFVTDRPNSQPSPAVDLPCRQVDPVWSPDGRHFAFLSGDEIKGNVGLWVADSDGSHPHLIVPARPMTNNGVRGVRVPAGADW